MFGGADDTGCVFCAAAINGQAQQIIATTALLMWRRIDLLVPASNGTKDGPGRPLLGPKSPAHHLHSYSVPAIGGRVVKRLKTATIVALLFSFISFQPAPVLAQGRWDRAERERRQEQRLREERRQREERRREAAREYREERRE